METITTLGDLLREAKRQTGFTLEELTALSPQNDPNRLDTPAGHRAGRWFRERMEEAGLLARENPIHVRGIFYSIVAQGSVLRPDGRPFVNDEDCHEWLQETAAKCGRWLGYVPFDKIVDARNEAPIVRSTVAFDPTPILRVILELVLPDDLTPRVELDDFMPRQAHHLVFWGEKTSLDEVLGPLAEYYKACLYLPSGEVSDTLLHRMAQEGVEDGRSVVLVFVDFDPSGNQMAVSIGHKLRCLKDGFFPELNFKVVVPAVTEEQVRDLDLPSSPLKPTEKRASAWRLAHGGRLVQGSIDEKGKLSKNAVVEGGYEQIEIDALATLRPDELRRIVRRAVKPYWDASLEERAAAARDKWEAEAQAVFEAQIDPERMASLQGQAEEAIENLKASLEALNLETEDLAIEWPAIKMPEPTCPGTGPALVHSDMELTEAIKILRARKCYTNGEDE